MASTTAQLKCKLSFIEIISLELNKPSAEKVAKNKKSVQIIAASHISGFHFSDNSYCWNKMERGKRTSLR
jgi:frataxin-like iron-binding protein CyaY